MKIAHRFLAPLVSGVVQVFTQVLLEIHTRGQHHLLSQLPAERRGHFWLQQIALAKNVLQILWGVADLCGDWMHRADEQCLEDGLGLGDGTVLGG